MSSSDRESAALSPDELTFNEAGLIPAIVQECGTGEVLMLAWMNAESLALTIEERRSWFFSRSRDRLWMKGEESGNVQDVVDVRYDCDADALLVLVESQGPACHTGERACFYRSLLPEAPDDGVTLADLLRGE